MTDNPFEAVLDRLREKGWGKMTEIKPDLVITDLPSPAPDNPLEALSWLGDAVEEVAEGLRARGIKGRQRESDSCAIAAYLNLWWSDVGIGTTTYYADNGTWEGMMPRTELPTVIKEFIQRFDNHQFPDLIDNG